MIYRTVFSILLVLTPLIFGADAAPYARDSSLTIYFAGQPVGTLVFSFTMQNDRLIALSELKIEEKKDKKVVYARHERRREVWDGQALIEFTNDIVENGQYRQVTATRIGKRLAISGPDGTKFDIPETVPATFWSTDLVRRQRIFDVATGRIYYAEAADMPPVELSVGSIRIKARQFLITGGISRNLFYDPDNRLIGMRHLGKDGRLVDYRASE